MELLVWLFSLRPSEFSIANDPLSLSIGFTHIKKQALINIVNKIVISFGLMVVVNIESMVRSGEGELVGFA